MHSPNLEAYARRLFQQAYGDTDLKTENEQLRAALRDAIDWGLVYWEPKTQREFRAKSDMIIRFEALLPARKRENFAPAQNQLSDGRGDGT